MVNDVKSELFSFLYDFSVLMKYFQAKFL